jgi:hypothetical protein
MNPSEEINEYISQHPDWRGDILADIRKIILGTEPGITEEWKWMGSPVWEKAGIICVGNIFKDKVQIVFMNGAFLNDPDKIFNMGLWGNQRRGIDFHENDPINESGLRSLVASAIIYNQLKAEKK